MSSWGHDDRDGNSGGAPSRGRQGGGRNGGGGRRRSEPYNRGGRQEARSEAGATVTVGGLPSGYTWKELKKAFGDAGPVSRADIEDNGIGVVTFEAQQDADWAIKTWNRTEFAGAKITVRAQRKGKKGDAAGKTKGAGAGKESSKGAKGKGKKEPEKKKTQDDLDAQMNSYWKKSGDAGKAKVTNDLDADMDAYFAAKPKAADSEPAAAAATEPTAATEPAAPVEAKAAE